MIKMSWTHTSDGKSYNKYLFDDLKESEDLRGSSAYFASSPEFSKSLYSSINGELAKRLNITGAATLDKLSNIDALIESRQGKITYDEQGKRSTKKRLSVEVNTSLDKTFSYAYNLLTTQQEKDRFIECLSKANSATLKALFEPCIKDKNGNQGEFISANFCHISNRDGVPHIHFHNNYYNALLDDKGVIRSIELPAIRDTSLKMTMDFVFKTEAIKELKQQFPELKIEAYNKAGHTLQPNDKVSDFRVAFTQSSIDAINAHSTLGERIDKEINSRIAALNNNKDTYQTQLSFMRSSAFREIVHKELKANKEHKSQDRQSNELKEHAASLNLSYKSEHDKGVIRTHSKSMHNGLLRSLTETKDSFSKNELIEHIAKSCCAGLESISIAQEIISNQNLVIYDEQSKRYISKDLCKLEFKNVDISNRLTKNEVKPISFNINDKSFATANKEQLQLVSAALGTNQFHIGVGLPGTGKSYTAAKVVEAAKANGYTTVGVAPTGKVAKALKADTHCDEAYTLDKLLYDLDKGKVTLNSKSYVVLDEAGMVGCRNWHKLLSAVEKSGARLLAIGDPHQLESVSAGDTLRQLLKEDAGKQATTLNQIIRQKDKQALKQAQIISMANIDNEDKENAVKLGQPADELFKALSPNTYTSNEDKLKGIAYKYLACTEDEKEKLILSTTNASVDELNKLIVRARLEEGLLIGNSVNGFYINDRVVITKNTKEYKNGDFGTILDIDDKSNAKIMFDDNTVKTVNLIAEANIKHSYATTVHKAQGITINKPFVNLECSQVNNQYLLNVAMTRGRELTETFIVDSERDKVTSSFKQQSKKADLLSLYKISQPLKAQDEILVEPKPFQTYPVTRTAKPDFVNAVSERRIDKASRELSNEKEYAKLKSRFTELLQPHYSQYYTDNYFEAISNNVFKHSDRKTTEKLAELKDKCNVQLKIIEKDIIAKEALEQLTAKPVYSPIQTNEPKRKQGYSQSM